MADITFPGIMPDPIPPITLDDPYDVEDTEPPSYEIEPTGEVVIPGVSAIEVPQATQGASINVGTAGINVEPIPTIGANAPTSFTPTPASEPDGITVTGASVINDISILDPTTPPDITFPSDVKEGETSTLPGAAGFATFDVPMVNLGGVAWATETDYSVGDRVIVGSVYECIVSHTSDVFASDLSSGKWRLYTTAASTLDLTVANTINRHSNFVSNYIASQGSQTWKHVKSISYSGIQRCGSGYNTGVGVDPGNYNKALSVLSDNLGKAFTASITYLKDYSSLANKAQQRNVQQLESGAKREMSAKLQESGLTFKGLEGYMDRTLDIALQQQKMGFLGQELYAGRFEGAGVQEQELNLKSSESYADRFMKAAIQKKELDFQGLEDFVRRHDKSELRSQELDFQGLESWAERYLKNGMEFQESHYQFYNDYAERTLKRDLAEAKQDFEVREGNLDRDLQVLLAQQEVDAEIAINQSKGAVKFQARLSELQTDIKEAQMDATTELASGVKGLDAEAKAIENGLTVKAQSVYNKFLWDYTALTSYQQWWKSGDWTQAAYVANQQITAQRHAVDKEVAVATMEVSR